VLDQRVRREIHTEYIPFYYCHRTETNIM